MKNFKSKLTLLSITSIVALTAFTAKVEPEEDAKLFEGYRSWYRVTKDAPNTGDPTGFLDKKHKGEGAFREIYINKIGETVNTGSGPYKYPEGTVVVKEAYKKKEAWEAKSKPQLTIMVKQAKGASPETGDWGYIMGAKGSLSIGTSKWAKFCSKCHVYAAPKDYVFINSTFLKKEKK